LRSPGESFRMANVARIGLLFVVAVHALADA